MAKPMRRPHKLAGGDGSPEVLVSVSPDHADIARLAYLHWLDRGCPIGSPDEDWAHAEQALKNPQPRTT